MVLLGYAKCSTCVKAKKWLDENAVIYEWREIKEDNPTREELRQWYEKSKLPLKKFFNTSGLVYKSLNLKEELQKMTEQEQINLLASDGMLVKRPLLISEKSIFVGFKPEEWKLILE